MENIGLAAVPSLLRKPNPSTNLQHLPNHLLRTAILLILAHKHRITRIKINHRILPILGLPPTINPLNKVTHHLLMMLVDHHRTMRTRHMPTHKISHLPLAMRLLNQHHKVMTLRICATLETRVSNTVTIRTHKMQIMRTRNNPPTAHKAPLLKRLLNLPTLHIPNLRALHPATPLQEVIKITTLIRVTKAAATLLIKVDLPRTVMNTAQADTNTTRATRRRSEEKVVQLAQAIGFALLAITTTFLGAPPANNATYRVH